MGGNNNKSGRFAKQYGPLKRRKWLWPWTENSFNVKQLPRNGITNLKHCIINNYCIVQHIFILITLTERY